ncbi:MAG: hypothetical protein FWG36_10135 [Oscillospiraceae bacterium]|nr:hypothetical protein [Oscillospiraceae bacterium]
MKYLKGVFFPFFVGEAIIISFYLISPWKFFPDSSSRPTSIFNVMFTILFLLSCCVIAFHYGKKQNKIGLFSLIGIWVLHYISLTLSLIFAVIQVRNLLLIIIFFSYCTLFLATNWFIMLGAPAFMIILTICSWLIGKNYKQRRT